MRTREYYVICYSYCVIFVKLREKILIGIYIRSLLKFRAVDNEREIGFETYLVWIDSRLLFRIHISLNTISPATYKKLIQLFPTASFLSNIAEQSRYTSTESNRNSVRNLFFTCCEYGTEGKGEQAG